MTAGLDLSRLGSQATSTTPRTDARQHGCNERCAWDLGARGSPAWFLNRWPCPRGSSRSAMKCQSRGLQITAVVLFLICYVVTKHATIMERALH